MENIFLVLNTRKYSILKIKVIIPVITPLFVCSVNSGSFIDVIRTTPRKTAHIFRKSYGNPSIKYCFGFAPISIV